MHCEGSRHDIYTIFKAPKNAVFLAQSENEVIGDSLF